jgi:uncharacterized protein (DUF169 family)
MIFSKEDLALFEKLNFPQKPVTIALVLEPPAGVERLNEKLRVCDMVSRARQRNPFYTGSENHTCEAGWSVLGYGDPPQPFVSGVFAAELKGYKTPRAGSRPYHNNPKLKKGQTNYVVFSTLDKLTFEPDLLLLCTGGKSTLLVLRALVYSTGDVLESRVTLSMECSWYIAYPYITGKVNHFPGSVGYATHRAKTWEPDQVAVCIPRDLIPHLMENLREMPWVGPFYGPEGIEFKRRLRQKLGLDTSIND